MLYGAMNKKECVLYLFMYSIHNTYSVGIDAYSSCNQFLIFVYVENFVWAHGTKSCYRIFR